MVSFLFKRTENFIQSRRRRRRRRRRRHRCSNKTIHFRRSTDQT